MALNLNMSVQFRDTVIFTRWFDGLNCEYSAEGLALSGTKGFYGGLMMKVSPEA